MMSDTDASTDHPGSGASLFARYAFTQAKLRKRLSSSSSSSFLSSSTSPPEPATTATATTSTAATVRQQLPASTSTDQGAPHARPLGPLILITGPPAVGKSTVAREAARMLAEHLHLQEVIRETRLANGRDVEAEEVAAKREASSSDSDQIEEAKRSEENRDKGEDQEKEHAGESTLSVLAKMTKKKNNSKDGKTKPKTATKGKTTTSPPRTIVTRRIRRQHPRHWWAADRYDPSQPHAGPSNVSRVPGLVPPQAGEELFWGGRVVVVHINDNMVGWADADANADTETPFVTAILAAAPPPGPRLWRKLVGYHHRKSSSSAATPSAAAADETARDRGKKTKGFLRQLDHVRADAVTRYLPVYAAPTGNDEGNTEQQQQQQPYAVIVTDCLAYRGESGNAATQKYAAAARAAGRPFIPVYLACNESEHLRRFECRASEQVEGSAGSSATTAAMPWTASALLIWARTAVQRLAAAEMRQRKKTMRFQPEEAATPKKTKKETKAERDQERRKSSGATSNSSGGGNGSDSRSKRTSSATSAASAALASLAFIYSNTNNNSNHLARAPTAASGAASSAVASSSGGLTPTTMSSSSSCSSSSADLGATPRPRPRPPPLALPVPRCVPGVLSYDPRVQLLLLLNGDHLHHPHQLRKQPLVVSLPAPGALMPFGGCMVNTSRLTACESAAQVVDFAQSVVRGEPSAAALAAIITAEQARKEARREAGEAGESPEREPVVELEVR